MRKLKHHQEKVDQLDIDAIGDELFEVVTLLINSRMFRRRSAHAQYKI